PPPPGGRARLARRPAEPAGPDDPHGAGPQPLLPLDSEPRQAQVPGIAVQFVTVQCVNGIDQRSGIDDRNPGGRPGHRAATIPSNVDDASARGRFGILPAPAARCPDSTARAIARAIACASWARVTAEASSTAVHPSSIARAASEAVPTPASRMI